MSLMSIFDVAVNLLMLCVCIYFFVLARRMKKLTSMTEEAAEFFKEKADNLEKMRLESQDIYEELLEKVGRKTITEANTRDKT